jgi:hypothetical protein
MSGPGPAHFSCAEIRAPLAELLILRAVEYQAVLGPDEVFEEKPFTNADNTEREVDVMQFMLEEERELAQVWAQSGDGAPSDIVMKDPDPQGRRHLLVVPSVRNLVEAAEFTAVGFFGKPREDVDHGVLFELEEDLVGRMSRYGELGLLSYYDVELVAPKGTYGNLILFSTPDVPEEWYRDEIHSKAVSLSSGHYHQIRLHKGSVHGSMLGGCQILVDRTKYFDFTGDETWFGLRRFRD